MEEIGRGEVKFRNPFMAFSSLEVATEALIKEFSDIPAAEVTAAARAGWDEMTAARDDMRKKAKRSWRGWRQTTNAASCWQAVPTMSILKSTTVSRN